MFGLFKKKSPPTQTSKLNPAVASAIFQSVGARSIPPMPGAAQKAFQLSVDPNAEARDFVDVIESDESLSARVIKIANSVYFDRGHRTTTIEAAVVVIGMNEIRCLLNATTLSEIFPSKHPARQQLWAHDVATALIARTLAERHMPERRDLAFLAGLMHDIGKLLLLQRATDDYVKVLNTVRDRGSSFCEVEAELFPFDHTEVGQLIGEQWRFGPELQAVIRRHHTRLTDPLGEIDLPFLIGVADSVAHAAGLGHPSGWNRFRTAAEERLPELWSRLGAPATELPDFIRVMATTFESEYELYGGTKGNR